MRKKYYLGGLSVLVGAGVVILGLRWYGGSFEKLTPVEEMYRARMKTQREHLSDTAKVAALPERQVVRLAIGSLGLPDDNQNGQLADLVATELSNTKGLELVERRSLDKALAELQMSLAGLVRAGDAVRAGKLVRADWFLLGTRTTIGGTNALVVRVVDARTGILRDAGVAIVSQAPAELASSVAVFVRQSRKNASLGKQSIYLGVGSFEDLSINSRQAGFPTELRGYLIEAFKSAQVTLLEREYVETLLQEVYLDLAGLTQESSAESATPMQSAFWLITGDYQSYETTNLQVEVELQLAPMFGRVKNIRLVGEPGEPLNRKIKAVIDQVISQPELSNIPTRRTEVSLLMDHGQELAGINLAFGGQDLVYLGQAISGALDEQAALRKRRNAEEALRAFQTVLLLEPTNREAKMFVAACLRNNTIQRSEEARQYYREVIEEPVNDKWSGLARQALSVSFDWEDIDKKTKALWFETVAAQTTSSNAAQFYRQVAEAAKTEILLKSTGTEAQALAEARLWGNMTNALLGNEGGPMGVEEFVRTYGTNRTAAAQRLTELYPKWSSQAPQIAPYILAAVVSGQVDTNAPLVIEFQQLLEKLTQHPDQVVRPHDFWWHIQIAISEWCWGHKDYRLMTRFMEAKTAASVVFAASQTNWISAVEITDEDKMSLAIAYLGTHEWDKAIPVLQSFAGQPVSMSMEGPWGSHGTVLFTDKMVEFCRKKLGLPVASNREEFQLGKPVVQLCRDQPFAMDGGGFWTALDDHVFHLDFELKTNLVLNVPLENSSPITVIYPGATKLWIGTDGEGLFEYDKATGRFRHLREKDGLLMDKIASLHLAGEELWVGYGRKVRESGLKSAGGLGKIDLRTGKSTSFTPSLPKNLEAERGALLSPFGIPARASVLAITGGVSDEIWFLADVQTPLLCRYRSKEKAWDVAVYPACSCLLRDPKYLFVGRYWNYFGQEKTGALGVSMLDLSSTNSVWRDLKRPDGLPPGRVTALTTERGKLWVGGFGYIACIDLSSEELEALAHIQAETVDRLQTGGGSLWAQANCCLYRVSLASGR